MGSRDLFTHTLQDLYSLSYYQISWSLEDTGFDVGLCYCFEIWQKSWQHCCWLACQISEQSKKSKLESHGFGTSLRLEKINKKSLFSVGTIKNENISWDQLLSDVSKTSDIHMEIIRSTIYSSYMNYV